MLFIHAHLMTMEPTPTGFLTIEDGFLLTQDGRIQNLGPMSQCPALSDFPAQEVYDLAGKSVYPGFIDAHCHMGLAEEGLNFEGDDLNEMTDPVTPHLRGIDAINPLNKSFSEAVDAAITTPVLSIKNPYAGTITVPAVGEIIRDDPDAKGKIVIRQGAYEMGRKIR